MILDEGYIHVSFTREASAARYRPLDTAQASVPARSSRDLFAGKINAPGSGGTRGTLEFYGTMGGRPQRALVGGELVPVSDNRTTIEVLISEPMDGTPKTPSCPGAFDHDLILGLPGEFAGAVLAAGVTRLWSAGRLIIDRAAYDEVDSSEQAFTNATRLLLEALRHGGDEDDPEVETALRTTVGRLR